MSEPRVWIARIEKDRYTDGPGPRTVVWLQGCSIRCPGCQNQELWERTLPAVAVWDAARTILEVAGDQDLTITGGEPFDHEADLWWLLGSLRQIDRSAGRPRRHIIVYTGYTWSHLMSSWTRFNVVDSAMTWRAWWRMLCISDGLIDILVDGPYVAHLDNDRMQWRGSSNQRAILVPESINAGALVDYDRVLLADWDTPVIEIEADTAFFTAGLGNLLQQDGNTIARCGERNGGT